MINTHLWGLAPIQGTPSETQSSFQPQNNKNSKSKVVENNKNKRNNNRSNKDNRKNNRSKNQNVGWRDSANVTPTGNRSLVL